MSAGTFASTASRCARSDAFARFHGEYYLLGAEPDVDLTVDGGQGQRLFAEKLLPMGGMMSARLPRRSCGIRTGAIGTEANENG